MELVKPKSVKLLILKNLEKNNRYVYMLTS